jgi:hypothetical protein
VAPFLHSTCPRREPIEMIERSDTSPALIMPGGNRLDEKTSYHDRTVLRNMTIKTKDARYVSVMEVVVTLASTR